MRRLARQRSCTSDVERGRECALWLRLGRFQFRSLAGPDSLQERLRRNAGAHTLPAAVRELVDLGPELRVVGTLREQRLVNAQSILLVTLLQVQLSHRLGDHGLSL